MTFLTRIADTAAPTATNAHTAASGFRTRTAALLAWLARRVERGAQARARRQAARMSAVEIAQLPEQVRMELGVNLPGARAPAALVQGLVGPAAYWAPGAARRARGDAKN
jgi:hypothetical protein